MKISGCPPTNFTSDFVIFFRFAGRMWQKGSPQGTVKQRMLFSTISSFRNIPQNMDQDIRVYGVEEHGLASWCTTLRQPWYKPHSQFSKKCRALWPRIDFDILTVKIGVLEFPKTTFPLHIICSTLEPQTVPMITQNRHRQRL